MNSTIEKFGYKTGLVGETDHWVVLLRPKQVTAGSLVLAAKSDAESFSELEREVWADVSAATVLLESALNSVVKPEKINYLALMMVDPHVHFHVIPRYEGTRIAGEASIHDTGWPKHPAMTSVTEISDSDRSLLLQSLQTAWAQAKPGQK